MKRFFSVFAPALLVASLWSSDAAGWEAATTHAGLSEQAALSSELHKRLQEHWGNSQGLYTMLTIPKDDAPNLFAIVKRLNPTHGYVPDASGRMSALSWLVLGSVVADIPSKHASYHFLSPQTGGGLTNSTESGVAKRSYLAALGAGKGPSLEAGGQPATVWWRSSENPLGYPGFASQFRKAVRAKTPGERERHLAGSLLAAGGMLHILHDLGTPSRVRNDLRAHQQQIGQSRADRGSRFERIASLAFGRLGIPKPIEAPTLASLEAHLSNPEKTGLADHIARTYFSVGTLPKSFKVTRSTGASTFRSRLAKHLRRPLPAPSSDSPTPRFDLVAARNEDGATWRSESGTCLAEYHIAHARISWSIPDDCVLDQLEAILPTVAGYGMSFLEALYPSDLALAKANGKPTLTINSKRYGAGSLQVFADTANGIRTEVHKVQINAGTESRSLPLPPQGSTRISVLFDGVDVLGNPLLATTSSEWSES